MQPQASIGCSHEQVRVPPFRVVLFGRRRGDDVLGAQPLLHHLREPIHHRGEHVVLGLQVGARLDRSHARHDPRLGVRQTQHRLVCGQQPAKPAAGRVIRDGVPADRQRVAGDEDVGPGEEDIDRSVGMRLAQVTVFDPLATPGEIVHCARRIEGLVRQRLRRQRLVSSVLPVDVDLRAKVLLRIFVRDDLRAGLSDGLVRASVFAMPIGVEQSPDALPSGPLRDGSEQVRRHLLATAIDHHQTVDSRDHHDVVARRSCEMNQVVTERTGGNGAGGCCPAEAHGGPCRAEAGACLAEAEGKGGACRAEAGDEGGRAAQQNPEKIAAVGCGTHRRSLQRNCSAFQAIARELTH